MPIASLYNIPETDETLLQWSFAHMDHHRTTIEAIQRQKNINLPLYPLDPMNLQDMGTWGYQHQTMHNDANAALGVVGQDLVDVDWQNAEQRAVWIMLQAQEHFQWALKTGIG
jgi:hypothetical protein